MVQGWAAQHNNAIQVRTYWPKEGMHVVTIENNTNFVSNQYQYQYLIFRII